MPLNTPNFILSLISLFHFSPRSFSIAENQPKEAKNPRKFLYKLFFPSISPFSIFHACLCLSGCWPRPFPSQLGMWPDQIPAQHSLQYSSINNKLLQQQNRARGLLSEENSWLDLCLAKPDDNAELKKWRFEPFFSMQKCTSCIH